MRESAARIAVGLLVNLLIFRLWREAKDRREARRRNQARPWQW